jgi:branched-chain amino acid transport system substrate-binding protein
MKTAKSRALAILMIVGVVALAACGSDSDGASGGSSGDEPLQVYFLNSQGSTTSVSAPEGTQAAEAAVDHINKDLGGINGRKIEMKTCFMDQTPATETKCANQAVADKPDVIVYGNGSLDNISSVIAERAGIPFLIYTAFAPETLQSKNAFAFTNDALAPTIGAGVLAKEKSFDSMTAIGLNFPVVTNNFEIAEPIMKDLGIDFSTEVVEYGAADQAPQWQAATKRNPDALLIEEDAATCVGAAKAMATLGFDGQLYMASICDTVPVHTAGGDSLNGTVYLAPDSAADTGSPDVVTYEKALAKYAPEIEKAGLTRANTTTGQFQVFMNLYAVLKGVKDPSSLNAKTIGEAMRAAKDVPLFMGGGGTFTCDGKVIPGSPALCALISTWSTFKDGKTTYGGSLTDQVVAAVENS